MEKQQAYACEGYGGVRQVAKGASSEGVQLQYGFTPVVLCRAMLG